MKTHRTNKLNLMRAAIVTLALLTAQTAWADSAFSGGSGTEADPYQIATTADLNQLATDVNGGNDYSGKYFVMTQDIAYDHTTAWNEANSTESNYEAIGGYDGTNDRYFRGTFDGAKHTVSGIRIYKGGTGSTDQYQGLFGQIESQAEVKSVILADARITGYDNTGAIVGFIGSGSTVTDCHALADVTVHTVQSDVWYHGGIAGRNAGTVTDCIYLGTTLDGARYVGAIAGYNFTGTVETSYYTDTAIQGKNKNGTTLGNAASAVGFNDNSGTATNSGLAHTVTLADGITLGDTPTGEGRVKAYGDYALSHSDGTTTTLYSTAGSTLALAYSDTPAGYTFDGFTVNGEAISGSTFTMPAADVTVSVNLIPYFTRTVDGYGEGDGGWVLIASPLAENIAATAVGNLVATPAENYDFYRFNQAADLEWENYKAKDDDDQPLHPDSRVWSAAKAISTPTQAT